MGLRVDSVACMSFTPPYLFFYCLASMNPEVQVGPFINAGSPPATQMKRLQPTPIMPCPSSPSLVHQSPRTILIHTYSIISSHTAPTITPHMTSGPAMAGVPVRFRTFHVTEPAHSPNTGNF